MMKSESEVVIVGAGPTGLMLGNLLGALGVRTVILERDAEVFPIPRATHMDEETVRNLALTGLMEQLCPHLSPFGNMQVTDRHGSVILTESVGLGTGLHGSIGSCFFHQPGLERVLRNGLDRFPNVTFLKGMEVGGLRQDGNAITISARSLTDDATQHFTARYAVGCDGGRSSVRQLLEIPMRQLAPPSRWLIVDTRLKVAADARLLPPHFLYRLGLRRLTLYAHGHGTDRRWEFRLYGDEPVPADAQVLKWVAEFIDPSRLDVLRIATYVQNALIAERWKDGRVLLAGDAAHLMPPAAGQGMCSGIRDAVNLAWKLHHVLQPDNDDKLLDTYAQERIPHLTATLRASLFLISRLDADSTARRWWKYAQMLVIGRMDTLRDLMHQHVMRPLPLHDGFLIPKLGGGQHLPCFVSNGLSSDADWPYGWAVVSAAGGFGPSLALRLADMGIAAVGHRAAKDSGWMMGEWLHQRHADYVIVRPDRIIHSLTDSTGIHGLLDVLEQEGVGRAELEDALSMRVKVA